MSIITKLNRINDVKLRLILLVDSGSNITFEELPEALSSINVEAHNISEPGLYITDTQGYIGAVILEDPNIYLAYVINRANFENLSLGKVTLSGTEWVRVQCLTMIPDSDNNVSYICGHPWSFLCDLEITFESVPNTGESTLIFGAIASTSGARYSCQQPGGTSQVHFVYASNSNIRNAVVLATEDHNTDKITFKYDSSTRTISSTYCEDYVVPEVEMTVPYNICLFGASMFSLGHEQVIQVALQMKLYKYACTYFVGDLKFTRNYLPVKNTQTGEVALRDFTTGDMLYFTGSGITSYED